MWYNKSNNIQRCFLNFVAPKNLREFGRKFVLKMKAMDWQVVVQQL